ncbi:MAG: hypothetical protein NW216_06465 [Hyphomicrobium sp.]|nr:hypothetical protein [Hyphomicrobium sp.]
MSTIGAGLRIVFGFAIAVLTAGLVQTLFVMTPTELAADRESWPNAGLLALYAATHTAVFAAPVALLPILAAEWLSLRGWLYFSLLGLAVAGAGFTLQYMGESGPPTIMNDYALKAFLSAGLAAGLAYWMTSGRFSGKAEA